MKKDARPEGMPWLSPYVTVDDVDRSIAFYCDAFGFRLIDASGAGEDENVHAELSYQDQVIMLGKEGAFDNPAKTPAHSEDPSPIGLYLYCEDVDQFYQNAIKEGAKGVMEPGDMFWGDRMCRLQDPDGYIWAFATHLGEEAVKEPPQQTH